MMMAMRPRPKLRTLCRWMLTILTVVLVVVWIGSGWFSVHYLRYASLLDTKLMLVSNLDRGLIHVDFTFDLSRILSIDYIGDGWKLLRRDAFDIELWKWVGVINKPLNAVSLPLWLPALLLAIANALMWRTHIIARRRKPGMCKKCGYDISGLVGKEACPECGMSFKIEGAQSSAS